ncbi:M67 family metallopeptidase [Parachitinimonas caeni]|uniref:M67 family metallopeptidase n=1 Tax=Parachitinimonas caeni TaxID=3031301 RepID=A0ABT7E371_9NEIS|nr:M67 family metallopeptidase [Parachitinimonas caeni]MDK2126689.1 M67 family metallopeptidase [Parachitinimonas caeni]
MLTLTKPLLEAVLAHAWRDHPLEACGVLAGPAGSGQPQRCIPLRNVAGATDFFRIDPQQQLQLWRELDAAGEAPLVIYHSHTGSRAEPSRDDIAAAGEPDAHYLIVSTDPRHANEVRSFRMVDGVVVEERVKTLASAPDASPIEHSKETS